MPNLFTKSQKVSQYGFFCGCIESGISSKHNNILTLFLDGVWHVKTMGFDVKIWESFEDYKTAYRFFLSKSKELGLTRKKQHDKIGRVYKINNNYIYCIKYFKNNIFLCFDFAAKKNVFLSEQYLENMSGNRLMNSDYYINLYNSYYKGIN